MRTAIYCMLAIWIGALASGDAGMTLLAAEATPAGVKVSKNRSVQTRRFDPDNPPAEMPPLEPPEAAVAVSAFSYAAQMRVVILDEQRRADGTCRATARIETIDIKIGLDVTIWLPNDATRKIKIHEDAHREISDHYFKEGESTARRLAAPYVGRTIAGQADDCATAVDEAIKTAIRELGGQYMSQIETRAGKAQKLFDEITDHGRNNVKESDAIQQAIEQADAAE